MGGRSTRLFGRVRALVPFLCVVVMLLVGCQASVDAPADAPQEQDTTTARPSTPSNPDTDDALDADEAPDDALVPQPEDIPADLPDDSTDQPPSADPEDEELPDDAGDITGDGVVDRDDFEKYLDALNLEEGDPGYLSELDLDEDGMISLVDYQMWYRIAFDEEPEE